MEYTGEGPASAFYHEAVKRLWFCFLLTPEARAGLGLSVLTLAGSDEADGRVFGLLQEEATALEADLLAMYEVGLLTICGCGVPADVDAGLFWLEEAAEQGLADAQYALGDLHARGDIVPGDIAVALDWFASAAEVNFSDAQERIDALLESLVALRSYADQGHADAQFRMGVLTWLGKGVARNERQGLAWLEAAAAQGHAGARERLRFLGEELPAMRKKAASGDSSAQFELARQLMLDKLLPQDLPEAIAWLKCAARQGHAEACSFLGLATGWKDTEGLLEELRASAAAGESWAVEALKHLPAGFGG